MPTLNYANHQMPSTVFIISTTHTHADIEPRATLKRNPSHRTVFSFLVSRKSHINEKKKFLILLILYHMYSCVVLHYTSIFVHITAGVCFYVGTSTISSISWSLNSIIAASCYLWNIYQPTTNLDTQPLSIPRISHWFTLLAFWVSHQLFLIRKILPSVFLDVSY